MAGKALVPLKTRQYPWDEWFARSRKHRKGRSDGWVRLYQEQDYNGMNHTFAVIVRRNASMRGYHIETRVHEGYVEFRLGTRKRATGGKKK